MLPYVDALRRLRIGVFITNPMTPKCLQSNVPIEQCSSPEEHVLTVWLNYIKGCGFSDVYLVAHGVGGDCVATIQRQEPASFDTLVRKVAFLECPSTIERDELDDAHSAWMKLNAIHYRKSEADLGTPLKPTPNAPCPEISAGVTEAGAVPGACFERVMAHFGFKDWQNKSLPE
jgi:hypothetical protein